MARKVRRGQIRPKILLNVGLGLDLVTGTFIYGRHGEQILNGGLPQFLTVAGPTNNYKSWITNFWNLTALNRIVKSTPSYYEIYDTEINVNIERLNKMGLLYENLDNDLLTGENEHLTISDSSMLKGDEWKSDFINYLKEQKKEKPIVYHGMLDPFTKQPLKLLPPNLFGVDTITEIKTTATEKDLQSYKTDDGSDNTEAMRLGKFKSIFISNLPEQLISSNSYMTLIAQLGETIDMGGKFSPKPMKKLQYLKEVDKIKGVPRVYYSLPGLGLLFHNSKALLNSDRKGVLYPSSKKEYMVNDLNMVRCTVLRNKSGHDGLTLTMLISKEDGILTGLTDFHTIKDKEIGNNFGISGNNTTYHLDLFPSVNIGRTTVRDTINDNKLLTKALEFTRDMFQLSLYKPQLVIEGILCTPEELYNDIKKLGYDWDILLNTVSWHTPDHYTDDRQFLTIMDLLNMRQGTYHPYWLDEDKKTILPAKEYKKFI